MTNMKHIIPFFILKELDHILAIFLTLEPNVAPSAEASRPQLAQQASNIPTWKDHKLGDVK